MASLKDMRNQIGSVKATQKITKAMQMVAAAKLKRAQETAENARPYAKHMAAVIANLAKGVSGDSAPQMLVGNGSTHTQLVVVATADRGLAGGFNSNIARAAREFINAQIAAGKLLHAVAGLVFAHRVADEAFVRLNRAALGRLIESKSS